MTDAQQIQYNRFLVAGYDPDDAAKLVERGAWLGTQDVSPQTVADVNRYRAERDRRRCARKSESTGDADR